VGAKVHFPNPRIGTVLDAAVARSVPDLSDRGPEEWVEERLKQHSKPYSVAEYARHRSARRVGARPAGRRLGGITQAIFRRMWLLQHVVRDIRVSVAPVQRAHRQLLMPRA
jgi:hypothetical protein